MCACRKHAVSCRYLRVIAAGVLLASIALYPLLPVFAAVDVPLVLENDHVKFVFEPGTGGLASMVDKRSGLFHVRKTPGGQLLWELVLSAGVQKKSFTNLNAQATLMKIEMRPDGTQRGIIEWAYQDWWREKGVLTIRVTVDLPEDSGIAAWRIYVDNKSGIWGLWTVRFPYVQEFLRAGKYDVAVPKSNWGFLYKACDEELDSMNPEWQWSMQFLCAGIGKNGVYMANHDPEGWIKRYYLKAGAEFYFEHYVEDMGVAGSDFPGPYACMLGVFQGDWFAGCKIYRKWAVNNASWTSEGPLSRRRSVPQLVKDIGLWMIGNITSGGKYLNIQEQVQPLIDAQRYFGIPIGFHWYNWHETPFGNNYPHFFPARAGFEEKVRNLTDHGVLVMPYINGWAVDDKIPDYARFYPFLCKTQTGTPFARIFGSNSGRLTVMCPSAAMWQRTITDLVDRLGNRGANAVYIDCIASVPPTPCFDKAHGHPLGGGHWRVSGYRKLLSKVQEVAHRDGRNMVVTSECNEETYMDGVDAFLGWIKSDDREIPMMPAVYSGYTLYFASPHFLDTGDRSFVMCQGRAFLWGCQNGWMGFDLFKPEHNNKVEYLKKIGRYRIAGKKFLTYGEMVDLIEPENHVPAVTEIWKDQRGKPQNASLPSAMGTVWKSEDGHLGVFMVNFLKTENSFVYTVNPQQYGIKSDNGFRITHVSPEGNNFEVAVDAEMISHKPRKRVLPESASGIFVNAERISRTEILEPWEIRIVEIAPE